MLVSESKLFDGVQMLYRFDNGYGASIVQHMHSYGGDKGLWELAVIQWDRGEKHWDFVYDTPVTDDVIGHLQWSTVVEILWDIKALPPIEPENDYSDENDGQPDEAQEWYDFDPDC